MRFSVLWNGREEFRTPGSILQQENGMHDLAKKRSSMQKAHWIQAGWHPVFNFPNLQITGR
jgi:hypothetical protein